MLKAGDYVVACVPDIRIGPSNVQEQLSGLGIGNTGTCGIEMTAGVDQKEGGSTVEVVSPRGLPEPDIGIAVLGTENEGDAEEEQG